jgi:hypothetical protein
MTIDRKFIIAAQNPVNGKKYSQENALILCAKDKAVPVALEAYKQECIRLGCNQEHIESIGLLIGRVCSYQANIESRIPDTIGDELKRCIDGEGV